MFQAPLFLLMVSLTLIVYWPGLNGPFLLDDFGNLDQLGKLGGVRNWETFQLYIFSNNSGVGGRPLSMLSFLLNDNNWPSDPFSFKYTNLLLHLLAGVLLTGLIDRLLRICNPQRNTAHVAYVALFTAALWLLHPFNVSTTLYVVQRMAILSALFSIAGLLVYVSGRDLLARQPRRAYALMTISVVIFTPLAVLSKENGALLPLLIAILEYTALRYSVSLTRPDPRWLMTFLGLPNLLIVGYFVIRWDSIMYGYHDRSFTLSERLLTESHILLNYLQQLLTPNLNVAGIFNENPAIAHSLLDPPTTLAAVLAIIVLIIGAWRMRVSYPLFSLAVLFFFAGHLLESTFLPLEIYFEHRNYLPAIFIFLPITDWIIRKTQQWRWLSITPFLFIGLFGFLTYQQAILWGNEGYLVLHWAQKNPYSIRAQRALAMELEARGRPDLALQHLDKILDRFPDSLEIEIHRVLLLCQHSGIQPAELAKLEDVARHGFYDFRPYPLTERLINTFIYERCRGVNPDNAHRLLDALSENQAARTAAGSQRQIAHLRGLVYLRQQKPEQALHSFQQSQQLMPDMEAGLLQVSLLARNGMFVQALTHLKTLQRDVDKNLNRAAAIQKPNFIAEAARLEKILLEDLAKAGQPAPIAPQSP